MRNSLLAILFSFVISANAQTSPFFELTYGTAGSDFTRGIVQTPDSFLFVGGYSLDTSSSKSFYTLRKLKSNGDLIWMRSFGDPLYNDNALGMFMARNGELIIWGERELASSNLVGFISRLDTSGNLIQTIDVSPLFGNLSLKSGTQLSDSSYVFAGFCSGNNANEIVIFRCDQILNPLTQFTEAAGTNAYGQGVVALPDTGYAVVADFNNGSDYDLWLTRYDRSNSAIWSNTYGDTLQNGSQGIILTSDNHLVIYGETEIFNFSMFDFFLRKIDLNGNSLWSRTCGGASSDAAFSILETWNGFIGTGYSNSFQSGPISPVVFRTDTAGSLLWAHQYGSSTIGLGYQIIPSLNNGFYITGNQQIESDEQCYLLHVDDGGWLGMNDHSTLQTMIDVFPNPSTGAFQIHSMNSDLISYAVYTAQGLLLVSETCNPSQRELQLELAPGMYILQIVTEYGIVCRKLMIEN